MSSDPTAHWELLAVGYHHPDARTLTAEVQRYYVQLYGGMDTTPNAEFTPPGGGFFVGYLDQNPVAMGGWRLREPTTFAVSPAELKRMYVVPAARRRGLASLLLARLESEATAAGADWALLETGTPQTAAVALYLAAGYRPVSGFGYYAGSVTLGKPLR